ncbi:transporter substrate-binding domain-containing protein [Ketogulonicigenium vulgare]|uniref:Amino acid ABC transporter n=1 Tax=Ketogulonicigenium vulgare (strain WSH-001) TaxID=759362 RepID=F9Y850_KETVW|nr:transporter substrate-binding domain-containing protein [Ketogulonicigenium vulgare]ADO41482.1 extracellular solute-binding protein [Ketogulonicigenium vulgare Y25]AEM42336.1 Amino acid ABC transporter [Ketogulonicigenium vulgare WSH-001]ALJ82201.1 amino acid ABC transporter [Ketogulonicigenium vulgare]ANW32854.1 amino acid ABC transporter [Ketogulonicigenium vulgare]AOZ53418.1 extracellular solute-binding protein [Ketogulonicigenium vulgare]
MKINRRIALLAMTAGMSLGLAMPAAADLAEIRERGVIRIAVAMGIPQYSYIDSNMQPAGSDVETARMLAEDLGVALELVEITNAARVPTIQTDKADLVVSALGITDERRQAIDFSVPYATLALVVAAPADIDISDYADLTGKRIALTRATTNDQDITANTTGAEILRFEDDATLITSVISGQVDIISSQSAVIGGINERRRGGPLEIKFIQRETNLGIGLAKGNPELLAWVDEWVVTNFDNGRLREVFTTYQHRDLPDDLTSR